MANPDQIPVVQWTLIVVQLGTLLALIVYVWKTWEMAGAARFSAKAAWDTVAEMRAARLDMSAPRIIVYFSSPDSHLANIIIENTGNSTAADVQLTFDPPLQSSFEQSALRFFDSPKVLPPHFRLVHLFDTWPQYFGKKLPRRYDVNVRYRRLDTSQEVVEHQLIDVAGFENLHFTTRKDTHDLVAEVERLRQMLDNYLREQATDRKASTAATELLHQGGSLSGLVAQIRATWGLLRAADEAPGVYVSHRGFHSALRHMICAALASAPTAPEAAEFRKALLALYLSVSDYRFETIGSQSEEEAAVEASLKIAESLLPAGQ